MKSSILSFVILILIAFALPVNAAVTLVGKNSGIGNTMTLPSVGGGILSGDIIVAGVQGDCAHLSLSSFGTIRSMQPNCGAVTSLWAQYRISPGSEPSTYPITANGGETTTAWDVRVYRGASAWPFGTWNPVEGGNGGGPNTTLNLPGSPGTTTGLPDEVFVGFFAWDCSSGSSTFTPPGTMGNGDNVTCVTGTNFGIYGGDLTKVTPGTISNQVGTISATTARAYTIGFTLVPAPSWSPKPIGSTIGTSSVAIPSGTVAGNTMVLFCAGDHSNNPVPGDPAWGSPVISGGGLNPFCIGSCSQNGTRGFVWLKTATGSDVTVTFSGASFQQCILSTYAGIRATDAFSSCFSGSTCQTSLTAPSVSTHNDIVIQMVAGIGGFITVTSGQGGEASASGGAIPDTLALVPAFLRQSGPLTGSAAGVVLSDYPFYGTLTNTPYLVQGNSIDISIALALIPTTQPIPPSSGSNVMMFVGQ